VISFFVLSFRAGLTPGVSRIFIIVLVFTTTFFIAMNTLEHTMG